MEAHGGLDIDAGGGDAHRVHPGHVLGGGLEGGDDALIVVVGEADPTADVEGIDVANKLSILMALAFDKYVPPTEIPTVGISKITMDDIEAAKAKGCKIKLIAQAKKVGDSVEYNVKPMEIENAHPLAGVSNEFNAIYVTGNAVDEVMFYGKGAGALPVLIQVS